ncbi:transcriptional repressor [Undibacterium pigrum]|uniref:Immunity protein 10 of polymorphic toxin system n=1 Tax=Undibacterium pigrum TaxID=401470 RepID=A0A318J7M9_9BURK|nr:transcriptional repressor [Undibacterium pigrum]PXX42680.1 hypothetical protein DFR42_105343 [Undibacterium pigrum]
MHLHTKISFSAFDERYEMAFLYCYDKQKNYCFSLSRLPDEDYIEIMVLDQVIHRVQDLDFRLQADNILVCLDNATAAELDHIAEYRIQFQLPEESRDSLIAALQAIFAGKQGLQIDGTYLTK